MLTAVLLPWLHYVAVIMMAGTLMSELYLLKLRPDADTVRVLVRVDRIFGASAIAVLATGLLRVPLAHGGKGLAFYLKNGAFHAALTLFAVGFAISVAQAVRLNRWRGVPAEADWRKTRMSVHAGLLIMVLLAATMPMMARAVGSFQ
ncbi:DUF2214 family protein [Sinimarinibacterium flocculans]|uniref:DUF2214 family protein n=1 Tax=Sinimarinibacterium flocculans TaxID=985250 RepID=UPI002490D10C|nr:DUF2214 family protein [Sinimarinibacterium flocculans]